MNNMLRSATLNDCKLLFDWANDPEVRKASFSSDPIAWSEHIDWFSRKLESSESHILILEVDNKSIGLIRFEKADDDAYLLSYSISKEFRGKSYSSNILIEGLNYLSKKIKKSVNVIAYVKIDNIPSQKAFIKNQFEQEAVSEDKVKFIKKLL
jgi:RimJ/RimL family protein N-acetyltransferase